MTDGRDTRPDMGLGAVEEIAATGVYIGTVVGRYWAMDRDKRWERTDSALAAIVGGDGEAGTDPVSDLEASYAAGVTDEFVEPHVYAAAPRLDPARDAAVFVNFRPDRARQLSERLLDRGVDLTTMTHYRDDLVTPVAFPEQQVRNTIAEVLSNAGLRQLHAAETEKYAHVTYFFNGGDEREWPGESRILVPSQRDVATYDQKPEMSADEVASRFAGAIGDGFAFGVVNFANPDMVGHTGSIPAVVRAVETVDACLERVVAAVEAAGGVCLITADHGNAEEMVDADGGPQTAHTTNPVPLVVTDPGAALRQEGELSDLVPTALEYLGLDVPAEMTGTGLVIRS
jgi:2,3-bisphosphoglycerate-independent phosphoglycerate mutase